MVQTSHLGQAAKFLFRVRLLKHINLILSLRSKILIIFCATVLL